MCKHDPLYQQENEDAGGTGCPICNAAGKCPICGQPETPGHFERCAAEDLAEYMDWYETHKDLLQF